jgi:NAD(P)-dependent dehydrogenase (short-subunit alcohol dehydrogenase family)
MDIWVHEWRSMSFLVRPRSFTTHYSLTGFAKYINGSTMKLGKPFEPAGSVAVVTGGASGIGRAICKLLARRKARHIIVADVSADAAKVVSEELYGLGALEQCTAAVLDVSDDRAVEILVDQIETEIGAVDLWCSNAGVQRGEGLGSVDDWRVSLDVNLSGHVNGARHVIPRMVKRGSGCFVITSSAAGLLTDLRSAPYTASKHAAVAIAEWLSIAHGEEGLLVSCVCPEGVRTGMTKIDSSKAGGAIEFLDPNEVAEIILSELKKGHFLILPHPRVAEYEKRRAGDRERWLEGMRKVRSQIKDKALLAGTN